MWADYFTRLFTEVSGPARAMYLENFGSHDVKSEKRKVTDSLSVFCYCSANQTFCYVDIEGREYFQITVFELEGKPVKAEGLKATFEFEWKLNQFAEYRIKEMTDKIEFHFPMELMKILDHELKAAPVLPHPEIEPLVL